MKMDPNFESTPTLGSRFGGGGGGSGFASLDHSRDSSRERPPGGVTSGLTTAATSGPAFKPSHSRHASGNTGRDDSSQERRPDSRQSDNMLPDLERFQDHPSSSHARLVAIFFLHLLQRAGSLKQKKLAILNCHGLESI